MIRTTVIAAALLFCVNPATAQVATGDLEDTFAMVRSFMEHEREVMIGEELRLTEEEALGFWPVYDRYRAEVDVLQDRYAEMIAEYADSYGELSEEAAGRIVEDYFEIETEILEIREAYVENFTEILSMQKVVRFYQMENRIDAVADVALMREIPLVDIPGNVERRRR